MSAVTPLRGAKAAADAPVPDGRAQIRECINRQIDAEHDVTKHKAAIERAREHVADAERAVEKATAAVGRAREAEAATIAKLARTAANLSPRSPAGSMLREARLALCEAEDFLEASRAAVSKLEDELVEFEQNVLRARAAIITAINTLIAGPAAAELEAYQKELAKIHRHSAAFWALVSGATSDLPDLRDWGDQHRARDAAELPLRDLIARGNTVFGRGLGADPDQLAVNSRIAEALRRWRSELLSDPDAKMPVLPE